MYAAVMISGLVDLLGHYTRFLPQGTEQVAPLTSHTGLA